jgi:hypothetical protein
MVAAPHLALHRDRASHCIHHAGELDQETIAWWS